MKQSSALFFGLAVIYLILGIYLYQRASATPHDDKKKVELSHVLV